MEAIIRNLEDNHGDSSSQYEAMLEYLGNLTEKDRWTIVGEEMRKASESVRHQQSVLFTAVENTEAGGPHGIKWFYEPSTNNVRIGVPNNPKNRGGRFLTVLHAIEIMATVVKNAKEHESDTVVFPSLQFVAEELPDIMQEATAQYESVLIPLTVHPPMTNALIIYPQNRHISPAELASKYYTDIVQTDPHLGEQLLRHTMLVRPKFSYDKPENKSEVYVSVLPTSNVRSRFNLVDVGRIGSWQEPEKGISIGHYHLPPQGYSY